ncbi:MAG: molybdopterin cofactor-binding domain-containing protein [Acidobacteriota bacterium]
MKDESDLQSPDRLAYRFDLERRDFLKVLSAIGGGLLVVTTVPAVAQESGRRTEDREATRELSSWIHVDDNGKVTAFTGKVELGQNIRTSLAQVVSDELRVPLSVVSMQMCDTDLVPFDMGTFGSRTTPYLAPELARAAATARELLIDEAAKKWNVDRTTVIAADGRLTDGHGRAVSYGDLTRGHKLTGVIHADAPLQPRSAWKVRGTPVRKVNGRDIVTGRHVYTTDVTRPGLSYGRVVRPDSIGATLKSLDDSAARAIPGVTVVKDGNFIGVVAPTERAAKRAAAAVRAEWQPLSEQPSSTTIYDYLRKSAEGQQESSRQSEPYITGDVNAALAKTRRVFEATYRIPYIAHVSLEPRSAVAEWANGKLTVWTGTQRPFDVRSQLAQTFRVPESQVRVIVPDMGSGYGGKHTAEHPTEAARLARAVGKPVKVVWTREEEFWWAYFRPAGVIDVKAGVDANGRLVLWEFDNINSGPSGIRAPYTIPNQRIQYHAADSPFRQGSYRGLAATANHYAREMHIDHIARALGVDPLEFRMQHLDDVRLRAVLKAVAERSGWPRPSREGRSLGIACGLEKGGYTAAAAEVSKAPDGYKVERLWVAFECGAVVNPDGLQNQVEGAVVQGLGGALFEAIDFANGQLLNGTMAQYRVPRFKDVPQIDVIVLDRPDLPSAGAGETPIVGVAPAIGSAARAFGQVDTALPIAFKKA